MPQNVLYRGVTSLHGLGMGVPLYLPPPPRPKHYVPHMGICLGRGGGGRRMRAVDGGDAVVELARWGNVGCLWACNMSLVENEMLRCCLLTWAGLRMVDGWYDDETCKVGWSRVPSVVRHEPR